MTAGVAILVPCLGRPQNVRPLLDSIRATTPEPYRVLFICDPGDLAEQDAIAREGGWMISPGGSYAAKINAGFAATSEPWVLLAADDLRFHPDWLQRAMRWATPDTAVIGTNDICNPRVMCGEHSTHSLVRRTYIERESGVVDEPGKVLHEGYQHEFCDDELVGTAIARGRYVHAFDAIVEHLHPLVGKAPDDATYQRGRVHSRQSRRLFYTRRRLWQASR
jgi:glycosyltransferase involved in cell wall biosynthesis